MTDEERDEQFYRDTEAVAFPKLDDHQLSLLEQLGERRVLKRDHVIFKAGDRDYGLVIVLRGELSAFEQRDGTELLLATGHERDFLADVSMLQGTAVLGTVRVTSDEAEILYVPAAKIRRALAEIPRVSTTIVNALIMRRRRLLRAASSPVFAFWRQMRIVMAIRSMISSTKIMFRIALSILRASRVSSCRSDFA